MVDRSIRRRAGALAAVGGAVTVLALAGCARTQSGPEAGATARPAGAVTAEAAAATGAPASTSANGAAGTPAGAHRCPAGWGAGARSSPSGATAPLVGVRAGTHPCSDSLVLEFAGRVDGYDVRYVPQVLADASGAVVPLAGGAKLQVTVVAPAYGPAGVTYRPRDPAHLAGVGVRARLPFRVILLPGPGTHSRVVVDVARGW